ncbi:MULTISPECIES: curli synthesis inhibitor [Franconibacter]|uniref:UPF0319 protein ACH50_16860 n=2 Tax=Franconibacter TaxID=1649295 RepID=A0A0J8VM72_9ENTR|nr:MULTISPECIES: DUF2057 family protein [Franconibacter]KMV33620.1 hypothetical protein ACH50_16860 [Franconibacter pulveris]GGD12221.1 UPF0319 protein [Franconibacter daqui]
MRFGLIAAFLFTVWIPASGYATTLHLSGDVDLLVLDGKKVSGSLLRGADSLELDNGPHQLVFRLEKTVHTSSHEQRLWISPALIVSFDTRDVSQVNFSLPRIETERESQRFDTAPQLQLLDGSANDIPIKLDVLPVTDSANGLNYERDVRRYNRSGKAAAMPRFVSMVADDSTLLSGVSELDAPVSHSQTLTEQRLKYWYQQADATTRSRFMEWAKQQPSS